MLLALRAPHACTMQDLIQAGWGFSDSDTEKVQAPLSRLRNKWHLSEIPRGVVGNVSHKLLLERSDIDALTFIDLAKQTHPSLTDIDRALGLFSDDPRSLYGQMPNWIWSELSGAVEEFLSHVSALSDHERAQLNNLSNYLNVVAPRMKTSAPIEKRARILIVEDDPGVIETLRGILFDFDCAVATTASEAMSYAMDINQDLKGAIVDRHLSHSLDSAGLTILAYLRDHRPDVPRVLLTSDHPEGPDLEIPRTYGLFEVVTKGGGGSSAPGIRDVVERMLGDRRIQAMLRLEAESAKIARDIGRRRAAFRREIRQRGATPARQTAIAGLDDLEQRFHDDHGRLETETEAASDDILKSSVDEFLARWNSELDDG